jgi:hypothetical protein
MVKLTPWQRPLSPTEDRLLWQVSAGVEDALGSRDPALLVELATQLISIVMFDHAASVGGAVEPTADMAESLVVHMMDRVTVIAAETEATILADAPVAGSA